MRFKKDITNKTIGMNFIEKIANLVLGILRVPLLLNYLSVERYGFWVLLTTIGGWFTMSDFGFGSSLKNNISKLKSENREEEIKEVISYCFTVLIAFCTLALIIIFILTKLGLFTMLWGKYNLGNREINLCIILFVLGYFPTLPLSITRNIYYIYNRGNVYSFYMTLDYILSIGIIFILIWLKQPMHILIFFYFIIDVIIQSALLLYFMYKEFGTFKILSNPIKFKNSGVMQVGMKYFTLQMVSLVINQTDNVIIERFAGMSEVAVYSICIQLYNIGLITVNVLSESLWTNYVNYYHKKLKDKLLGLFKNHRKFSYIYAILGTVVYVSLAKPFINIWTNNQINPPTILIIVIGLLFLVKVLNSPLVTFLNSLAILNKQIIPSIVNAIFNLVMSIILVKYMGITGVALGTLIPFVIFSLLVNTIICMQELKKGF